MTLFECVVVFNLVVMLYVVYRLSGMENDLETLDENIFNLASHVAEEQKNQKTED